MKMEKVYHLKYRKPPGNPQNNAGSRPLNSGQRLTLHSGHSPQGQHMGVWLSMTVHVQNLSDPHARQT